MYCKTYKNSYIANCSVVQPELWRGRSRTTFVQWTPTYWVSPESWCHCKNDSRIVMRAKRRIYVEKEKRLSTSYLQLLIILDFRLF